MTHYSRTEIGLRPTRGRTRLDRADVEGVALHWPGTETRYQTAAGVMAALRGWQRLHMDTNGWSDIAYQLAFDQHGNTYGLRGLRYRSGANGDTDVNERYGAFLLVLAIGEQPTPAMIAAVTKKVGRFFHLFPDAARVVGHLDVRPEPTACPGPAVMRLIHSNAFTPHTRKEIHA